MLSYCFSSSSTSLLKRPLWLHSLMVALLDTSFFSDSTYLFANIVYNSHRTDATIPMVMWSVKNIRSMQSKNITRLSILTDMKFFFLSPIPFSSCLKLPTLSNIIAFFSFCYYLVFSRASSMSDSYSSAV